MNKRFTAPLFFLLLISCGTTKTVSFKTYNDNGEPFVYSLELPKDYRLTKLSFHSRLRLFLANVLLPSNVSGIALSAGHGRCGYY